MESLNCLRCGAPHEPDATVCVTCGAPIGETQSPTQPVRALKIPKATSSAPVSAPAAISAPVPARAQTPARRKRGWPALFAVCVLVVLLLGGAAYIVRNVTAGPPVAHQTVYSDAQHRFHFQRPALWLVTPSSDGVTLTDATGVSTATIVVTVPQAGEDATTHANALATQLGVIAASPRVIGGRTWQQLTGDVTGSDGAVRHLVVLVTVSSGQLYTIEFSSPTSSFSGTDNLVYEPLLATFAFS